MTTKSNLEEAVIIERTLNAPVAQVWKALTDVDQMRQWYFDLKEFKPEVGFEFEFVVEHEGTTYHHLCRVTEVISEKKIAYTWRYKNEPGDSLVTIELFAEGNKTRLKLTHSGIETFPKTPAYARKNFEAGWTQIIGSELKQFVEKTGKKKS
ncbi:MAG: SRPBCC domain-containing protein [Verrucomicrobia bacterium]|nr:MAG: SRPBCC domain-containing protein [Verrucomicrobiota bacterium]PYK76433.1 MAG: SRPBCC domain-containing protein [Verrucomicrobiota bacterium]